MNSKAKWHFRRKRFEAMVMSLPRALSHGATREERSMKLITLAGAAVASAFIATSAYAGTCPADQQKADVRAAATPPARGVTDTVLASIDLANEPIAAKDRLLRFRKLTIEPGGIVPWHSHTDRPAIIFVQQGEIFEYASNCAVPILHKRSGERRVGKE